MDVRVDEAGENRPARKVDGLNVRVGWQTCGSSAADAYDPGAVNEDFSIADVLAWTAGKNGRGA
jgi:hypothetical protein